MSAPDKMTADAQSEHLGAADPRNPTPTTGRMGRDLVLATRAFAKDSAPRSWWCVLSSFALMVAILMVAAMAPWLVVRLAASVVGGLMMVRCFVLYHDYLHGAILRRSPLARGLFFVFGLVSLTPPASWRQSHNYHHAHVGQMAGSRFGSFPVMSIDEWRKASWGQRLSYRISRHPLTILFAYVTVFLWSICLTPLFVRPRKSWDSALSALAHGLVIGLLLYFGGPSVLFFSLLFPAWIAAALGAYLFYAQHNFEGVHNLEAADWDYCRASLETSSYMDFGPVMRWFTANIGYHHIHHINPRIPFYRLPQVMAAIPELQQPSVTSLRPRDIWTCLRLNLWDATQQRMVSYRDARLAM